MKGLIISKLKKKPILYNIINIRTSRKEIEIIYNEGTEIKKVKCLHRNVRISDGSEYRNSRINLIDYKLEIVWGRNKVKRVIFHRAPTEN